MADMAGVEKLVINTMSRLGAVSEAEMKTAGEIAKGCNRPRGLVTNALASLVKKGTIKRVAREKASGYYMTKPAGA